MPKTSLTFRRSLAAAAPLALVALGLSACNPAHVTTMDSPTPSGSHMVPTYSPSGSPSGSASAGTGDSSAESEQASISASSSVDPEAAGLFTDSQPKVFTVSSLKADGTTVQTGSFRKVTIAGDPEGQHTRVITQGLCSGVDFVVTQKGDSFAAQPEDGDLSSCSATDRSTAEKVQTALTGELKVTKSGKKYMLKNGTSSVELTPAS